MLDARQKGAPTHPTTDPPSPSEGGSVPPRSHLVWQQVGGARVGTAGTPPTHELEDHT